MKNEKLNICALITGRGNNTLKNKNIRKVLGKPLLAYGAAEAKKVEDISSFFVSSEDEKILEIANAKGYKKIKRPKELALSTSDHVDCLIHAIDVIKKDHNVNPDIIVVILANCATIKKSWIEDSIKIILKNKDATSVIPVQKNNDHHPYRAKRINKNGYLDTFVDLEHREVSSNRQGMESNYFACHNFWVLNLNNMKKDLSEGQLPWTFMGNKIVPYIVDYSLDVHKEVDIYLTEEWLKKNNK